MILEKGEMWSVWGKTGLWLFTGNSYINQKGELVMGRGLALEAKNKVPTIQRRLGTSISLATCPVIDGYKIYGVECIAFRNYRQQRFNVGAFQVKRHFKDVAELSLIGYSCIRLKAIIEALGYNRVDLNFPGIGCGRLKRDRVLPIISELPDCVHVWEKE